MNNLCAIVESETVWYWIQKSKTETETQRGNKQSLADKTTKDISENRRKKNKTKERKK